MKCPKCSSNIDENALICPNCKKVLKLVCPNCKTVNKSNSCKKCGFTIIGKCHQCGKINETIKGTCSKCGFSTYTSVAISSSLIDEFACLTIEFPNLNDVKHALGSTKLFEKFKLNLDKLIFDYTHSIGLSRQIIEDTYIIRFNKDDSFSTSAHSALNSAIEILNIVTELNFKLDKLKQLALQCNIAVLKRDIYSKPDEYKSGFDIKLIYQNTQKQKLLNNLQVITDIGVYQAVCNDFPLTSLTANFIKNEMVMFFELNLKKLIKIPVDKPEEASPDIIKKPMFMDENEIEAETDSIYDVESINFEELKCNFIKIKSISLIPQISAIYEPYNKRIISIKCDEKFLPKTKTLIDSIEQTKFFNNIFRVTCYDGMKYKPYGFFYELISNIYNYSQSTKIFEQNVFSAFEGIDVTGFVKNLINFEPRKFPHPEDVRYSLFDIFLRIFQSMSNSLLYIENFEKIDDTSLEVLQSFFEQFDELNLSYLIVGGKDFSLHKNSHFLLSNPDYIEITPTPTGFSNIIDSRLAQFKDIIDSYYLQKISQNTKGSPLYFELALNYLQELGLISFENEVYSIIEFENVLIPPNIDELIIKRFKKLSKDAYKLLGSILLIGPRIDFPTIKLLDIPDDINLLKMLVSMDYIYIFNNSIYVQNHTLYKKNFMNSIIAELKREFASNIIEKVYSMETASPVEAELYNILNNEKKEFIVWEKLSHLNTSLGDFSAYLNCSVKFLKLIDNHIDENSQKTINEYKMEVYENLSNLLYKYTPDKIQNIAQIILENLEKSTDDKKVINLCNKMLQGCLISGNYSHALKLTHKILSKFPHASLDPKSDSFNIAYFLISLVKLEVLFSIGDLNDCIELGNELLTVITKENLPLLKPEQFSLSQFEELIFDNFGFVALAKILMMKNDLSDFLERINTNLSGMPETFNMFLDLEKTIHSQNVDLTGKVATDDSKFSKIIFNLVRAFSKDIDDYKKFASDIYQAKINAKLHKLIQIELICDLLIGYSYFKLGQDRKASTIYYSVLETSTSNGLKTVTYVAWYLVSILKIAQNDFDLAFGIASNAIIQLEKDNNSSELILFFFKIAMSEILAKKGEIEQAELCLNHARFINEKYGLNMNVKDGL